MTVEDINSENVQESQKAEEIQDNEAQEAKNAQENQVTHKHQDAQETHKNQDNQDPYEPRELRKNKTPKNNGEQQTFVIDTIWYSDEKRMNSIWKLVVMEDTGILKIDQDYLIFTGNKSDLKITDVTRTFITKQKPNYGAHFISWLICTIVIGYTYLSVIYSMEFFLLFMAIIIILYPVSLFGFRVYWIGIEYKRKGMRERVYFTDGSAFGWKNFLKGPDVLFNNLNVLLDKTN